MKKHIYLLLLMASLTMSACSLAADPVSQQTNEPAATETSTGSQQSSQAGESSIENSGESTTSNDQTSSAQGDSSESVSSSNIEASSSEEVISSSEEQSSSIDGSESTPPTPSHTHTWDAGTITTPATCTSDGEKTYHCTGCSETKTEKINKTGHSLEHHAANAATSTEDGNIEYWECETCHSKFSDANGTTSITDVVIPATGEPVVRYKVKDSNILHAFNWSVTTVKNNLQAIKDAGYGTVQLSPLQVQKDPETDKDWLGQWWKLYQPVSLSIATSTSQNVLGTKAQLTELCTAADALGINIIIDVVANHLAGGDGHTFNIAVQTYEPVIYNNNLMHNHSKGVGDGNDLETVVRGYFNDCPDLKTEDTRVQNRVISLLEEYIDCGVVGFRFDAAKHIETPNDGVYASQFWPNVMDAVNTYAEDHNKSKPYCYGEIMGGRNCPDYIPYMSVADWWQSNEDVFAGVSSHEVGMASVSTYRLGIPAYKTVLWAESHDNYSNAVSNANKNGVALNSYVNNKYDVDKAYAIQASRNKAQALYLARPNASGSGTSKQLTTMGNTGDESWKSAKVAAANEFHNIYTGQSEYLANDNGCFINYRGDGTNKGVAIVNVGDPGNSKQVNVPQLTNGTVLRDLVSGAQFTVTGGKLSLPFTNDFHMLVPVNYNPTYNPSSTDTLTFIITDNFSWGGINVHYWGGKYSTSWPGSSFTDIGDDGFGHTKYYGEIPADATQFIINYGGNQTADLKISDYFKNSKTFCGIYFGSSISDIHTY